MKTVTLSRFKHNGADQLGLNFRYDEEIKTHVEKLSEVRWSKTHARYYVPFSTQNKYKVYRYLRKKDLFVDYSALRPKTPLKLPISEEFLKPLKPAKPLELVKPLRIANPSKTAKPLESAEPLRPVKVERRKLSEDYRKSLYDYVKYLKGLRLSESTVRTYSTFIADLFDFLQEKPFANVDNNDIRLFTEFIVAKKKYSISSHRQLVSAIKHLSDFYPECQIENPELKRPPKSKYLPTVLSQREVIDLLRSTANLKHRAVLALIYSAGLRVGEAINLELVHIDIDRRQLFIKNGKGRKDRFVVLAESFLPLFQNYFTTYAPTTYFVEGSKGKKYSANSIRSFLNRACKKAGIHKTVTPHTLRHSYATHLIENGTGLRHVQEPLGHSKPETTMIYTHIAKKDMLSIKSPLDTALMKLSPSEKRTNTMFLSGNWRR
jgi:site-specific recombinase XerD